MLRNLPWTRLKRIWLNSWQSLLINKKNQMPLIFFCITYFYELQIENKMSAWLIDLLVHWFLDSLIYWLIVRLIDWLIGCLLDCSWNKKTVIDLLVTGFITLENFNPAWGWRSPIYLTESRFTWILLVYLKFKPKEYCPRSQTSRKENQRVRTNYYGSYEISNFSNPYFSRSICVCFSIFDQFHIHWPRSLP